MTNTFHGSPTFKQHLLSFAARICGQFGSFEKVQRSELYFSSAKWCQSPYVCNQGKGCKHRFYADEVGVPVGIAYIERALFLNAPPIMARHWWTNYLQALPVGVDLSTHAIEADVAKFVLGKLLNFVNSGEQRAAVQEVLDLFTADCQDEALWKAAATTARRVYQKSPYDNRRMEYQEAFEHAGCMACLSASYFAASFEDPRTLAEAVSWSAWAVRYHNYAILMQSVDRKGALWYSCAERSETKSEALRHEFYQDIGDFFLNQLRQAAPGNTFQRSLRYVKSLIKA